jgi:hypothetical protein
MSKLLSVAHALGARERVGGEGAPYTGLNVMLVALRERITPPLSERFVSVAHLLKLQGDKALKEGLALR